MMKKYSFVLTGLFFASSSFAADANINGIFFQNNSQVAVCPYVLDHNVIISLRPLQPGTGGFFAATSKHYAVQALTTTQSGTYTLCVPELISTATIKECAHSPETATVSGAADDLQLSCQNR